MMNVFTEQKVSFHDFRVMNTDIRLWLDVDPEFAGLAFAEVVELFRDVERALSRFDPLSELSRLNAAAGEWVAVSKLLWEVTTLALEYAEETAGIFDPTILKAICAAGYDRSFSEIENDQEADGKGADSTSLKGRWEDVGLDSAARAISLPPGTGLDLGGIAKGYTAQWAAQLLCLWGSNMVEAGGDVMTSGRPGPADGWPVSVSAPRNNGNDPGQNMVTLSLSNEALATSGVDRRAWMKNGRRSHHIIDPRTGHPADTSLLTVSALAENSVAAEIWSKVGLIMGLDALTDREIPALAVDQNRDVVMNEPMAERIRWRCPEFDFCIPAKVVKGE